MKKNKKMKQLLYILPILLLFCGCGRKEKKCVTTESQNTKMMEMADRPDPKSFVLEYDSIGDGDVVWSIRVYDEKNKCIYTDSSELYQNNSEQSFMCYSQEESNVVYLLLRQYSAAFSRTLLVLEYNGDTVKEHLLCGRYCVDLDDDGEYEIIGAELREVEFLEDDTLVYYTPVEVYRLTKDSLQFDLELSKYYTILEYGCYIPMSADSYKPMRYNQENYFGNFAQKKKRLIPNIPLIVRNTKRELCSIP